MLLALALSLLMFAGCSQQKTTLPTPPPQSACTDFVTADDSAAPLADLQSLLGLSALLSWERTAPASYKDALLGDDTVVAPTAALPVPLPKTKLVKEVGAIAIAAVDAGTYWPTKTFYVNDGEELWGFQVAAPEDSYLVGCDGDAYYCYYYMDREVVDPVSPVYDITPYSEPIADSVSRVTKALRDPDTIINRTCYTDGYYYYIYTFDYPDGDGYRRFGICKFNLCLLSDPPEDPFK